MTEAALPVLPDDPSWLTRHRVGVQCLLVLKDAPGDPEAGALLNEAMDTPAYEALVPALQATADGRRLLLERPSLAQGDLDLDALAALPPGSLGRELADYYRAAGLTPFETRQRVETDVDYISKRYRETHDIYHLVTGYGVDVVGEMELQAFVMGNLGIRSPRLMLPMGFLGGRLSDDYIGAATEPVQTGIFEYYRRVFAARRRGRQAPPLISVLWEDEWATPVAELRARLIDAPTA